MSGIHTILRMKRMGRQTKLQETCGRLTRIAQELGPEAKLPTVLELRDRLHVSVATLNSALTELEAQRIIRRKHGVGIYVSPGIRQHNICLLCDPSFFRVVGASPFWSLLVEQVRRRAELDQETFTFHFTAEAPGKVWDGIGEVPLQDALASDIIAGRVQGVLAVGVPQTIADWISAQNTPLVAFAGPAPYVVSLDATMGIGAGVAELAKRGCRRIGLWRAQSPYRVTRNHPKGISDELCFFQRVLSAHSLCYHSRLVQEGNYLLKEGAYHTMTHTAQGFHAAQEMYLRRELDQRPDGIVSTDDMMTQGAMTLLQRAGVRVGEELHIATHANVGSPALLGWEDMLILTEVNPEEIVQQMFDTLELLMKGRTPPRETVQVTMRLRPPTATTPYEMLYL